MDPQDEKCMCKHCSFMYGTEPEKSTKGIGEWMNNYKILIYYEIFYSIINRKHRQLLTNDLLTNKRIVFYITVTQIDRIYSIPTIKKKKEKKRYFYLCLENRKLECIIPSRIVFKTANENQDWSYIPL